MYKMSSSLHQMAATLIERSKTLKNNDLKRICKEERQPQSGNKAQLQGRVIGLINGAVNAGNAETLRRLQYRIQHHGEAPPPNTDSPSTPSFSHPTPNGYGMANGYQNSYTPFQQPLHQQITQRPQYQFKDSPFFEIRELVMKDITLEASPSHRQNCSRNLILNDAICSRLKSDLTLRLLLFSTVEQPLAPYTRLDVAFPSQIEVRINGDEVKANYKGLKNKPGSTRPVDITSFVRTSPANYRNNLVVTYALTQKASRNEKYNLFIYMVRKSSVEELAVRIRQRNVITKQSVLTEMMKKANDPDIVVESSVMSLKDPISTLRITTPCRSTLCTHNQCFDAESFLQLQEQAPTWQCPICNKTVSFPALAIDEYVQEILDQVPRGTDQVTIEPNGQWSNEKEKAPQTHNGYAKGISDDDIVELYEAPDYRVPAIKNGTVHTPLSLTRTPPLSSRETSTAPRTGSKRTSEVIDLTLSDDDEPPRPAKKVAYNTPSSLPDPTHRYQLPSFISSSVPMRAQPQPHSHHSMSPGLRLEPPPLPQNNSSYGPFCPPPPPRSSYPGQRAPTYPAYLSNSP